MATPVTFAIAVGAGLLTTPAVRWLARRTGRVAQPQQDRWHTSATALLGGVAIYVGATIAVLVVDLTGWAGPIEWSDSMVAIGIAATVMLLVGLYDDTRGLSPTSKLVFQTVAASIVMSAGVVYQAFPWTPINVVLTLFWYLAITN